MATVNFTSAEDSGVQDGSVVSYSWTLTSANSDGAPMRASKFADRCFTFAGTWGGATAAVEFSNDGTNWVAAHNAAGGAAITAAVNGGASVIERSFYMRPNLTTVGTGASITVICCAAVGNPLRT